MTILTVALKYLRGRLVATTLTAVSIALGVSLVVASVLLARGIKEGFIAGATDYNLVVGAKGSPMQLVLSVVFRMDLATPNIEYTIYRDLQQDQRVEAVAGLRARGVFGKHGFQPDPALARPRRDAPRALGAVVLQHGDATHAHSRSPVSR